MRSTRRSHLWVLITSLMLGITIGVLPALGAFAQDASPVVDNASNWPVYSADLSGTRSLPSNLDSTTAPNLVPAWSVDIGGPISATPVIVDGVVYAGSYDGNLYALDLATGSSVWTYATGAAVPEPNLGIDLGITGSAAVADGVVYVGDASATVHAVDAATGSEIWSVKVDQQTSASIWSSPVVWNGTLYIGVASIAKEVGFRGSVVALDAATGEMRWQTYMVPDGSDGAGVFDVPAIDPERNLVFVGTQNAYTANPAPYGDPISVVALDAAYRRERLGLQRFPRRWNDRANRRCRLQRLAESLLRRHRRSDRDLVGIGQKSGVYWALEP